MVGDGGDPVAGQRVGHQIGILMARAQQFLVGQRLQEFEHAARRLPGRIEETGRRGIRLSFLSPAVAKEVSRTRGLTAEDDRGPHVAAAAGDTGRRPEQGGEDLLCRAVAQRFLGLRQVAAGDVAGFVGDDADQLAGVLDLHQQPGIEEQLLATGDEGVYLRVLDDVDLDRRRIEAGDLEHWRGELPNGIFDLRVTYERTFLRRRFPGLEDEGGNHQNCRK